MASDPKGQAPKPAASDLPAPKRPRAVIHAELTEAKAKLHSMHADVEKDRQRMLNQQARIERAKLRWKQDHDPDDPFDPNAFEPPLRPYPGNQVLHQNYHRQHYVIARLEDELAAAAIDPNEAPITTPMEDEL